MYAVVASLASGPPRWPRWIANRVCVQYAGDPIVSANIDKKYFRSSSGLLVRLSFSCTNIILVESPERSTKLAHEIFRVRFSDDDIDNHWCRAPGYHVQAGPSWICRVTGLFSDARRLSTFVFTRDLLAKDISLSLAPRKERPLWRDSQILHLQTKRCRRYRHLQ